MESPQDQEFISSSNDLSQIVKGKRTKRHRSSSPEKPAPLPSTTLASSSSSGCCVAGDGGDRNNNNAVSEDYYGSNSSPTSSSEVYQSTEEEEDMAYCLILLAQGDGKSQPAKNHHRRRRINGDENGCGGEKISARKVFDVSSERTINKAGFLVYECKTCNRSFPSFQALGGHRASHKKPKSAVFDQEKKVLTAPVPIPIAEDHDLDFDSQLNKLQVDDHKHQVQERPFCLQLSPIKPNKSSSSSKIHECSICGSEFTSGQALGGHMRRHRANNGNNSNNINNQVMISTVDHDEQVRPRNILSLDLNFPAPEDDHHHRESKFQFVSTQQALVFSAPALVDCYY